MQRFWARVRKSDGCWLWDGPPGSHGYGQALYRGKVTVAHRVAYELARGPVPDGLFVCHRCDVKLCVNPEHLFVGTHDDNMADHVRKGRHLLRRLSPSSVASIRELLAQHVPQRAIAKTYGITQRSVHNIQHRITYRYEGSGESVALKPVRKVNDEASLADDAIASSR